jgi:hypothetical protein
MVTEKPQNILEKQRSCRLNQRPPTGNTGNPPTLGNQPSLDVSPIWTLFAAEVENLQLRYVQINVKVVFMLMLHRKCINFRMVHIVLVLWFHRR